MNGRSGSVSAGRIQASRPGCKEKTDTHVAVDARHTVYIVDNDDAVRDSLGAFLEAEGYAVRSFMACKEFESVRPSADNACLLLHFQPARYGGEKCLRCLTANVRQLPVIVMSGPEKNSKNRALRAGAQAFIETPLNTDELLQALQSVFA